MHFPPILGHPKTACWIGSTGRTWLLSLAFFSMLPSSPSPSSLPSLVPTSLSFLSPSSLSLLLFLLSYCPSPPLFSTYPLSFTVRLFLCLCLISSLCRSASFRLYLPASLLLHSSPHPDLAAIREAGKHRRFRAQEKSSSSGDTGHTERGNRSGLGRYSKLSIRQASNQAKRVFPPK